MKYTVATMREILYSMIWKIGEQPEGYARNPGKDFTLKRTLMPAVLIYRILTMDEKVSGKDYLNIFKLFIIYIF